MLLGGRHREASRAFLACSLDLIVSVTHQELRSVPVRNFRTFGLTFFATLRPLPAQ
jgi:hypothetical protein